MRNLKNMLGSHNVFVGSLPGSWANWSNAIDVALDFNNLTGLQMLSADDSFGTVDDACHAGHTHVLSHHNSFLGIDANVKPFPAAPGT